MISNDPKFSLSQLNAYKLMFAIKLSMEKRIKEIFWLLGLPAINATIFNYLTYFQKMAAEREGGGSGSGSSEKTEEGKQAEEPKKEDKQ